MSKNTCGTIRRVDNLVNSWIGAEVVIDVIRNETMCAIPKLPYPKHGTNPNKPKFYQMSANSKNPDNYRDSSPGRHITWCRTM